jgi:hypothetical protein
MECRHLQPGGGNDDDGFMDVAKAYTIKALPWAATAAVGILVNLATALYSRVLLDDDAACPKFGGDKKRM